MTRHIRLGQHFLKDSALLRRIVRSLRIAGSDTVIEVGPGHGELTLPLLDALDKRDGKLITIERDERLCERLKQVSADSRLAVFHGDVLDLLPEIVSSLSRGKRPYRLIGNIPYYLTGKLLRLVGDFPYKPDRIVFLLQREVAERIVARPPKMNLLAASVQFWSDPEITENISRRVFRPVPAVDSAVLACAVRPAPPADAERYYRLLHVLFKQPRKTILNNLRHAFPKRDREDLERILSNSGIDPSSRPQDLSLDTLIKLSQMVYTKEQ